MKDTYKSFSFRSECVPIYHELKQTALVHLLLSFKEIVDKYTFDIGIGFTL